MSCTISLGSRNHTSYSSLIHNGESGLGGSSEEYVAVKECHGMWPSLIWSIWPKRSSLLVNGATPPASIIEAVQSSINRSTCERESSASLKMSVASSNPIREVNGVQSVFSFAGSCWPQVPGGKNTPPASHGRPWER